MSTEPQNMQPNELLNPEEIVTEPLARLDQVLLLLGAALIGGVALGAAFHVVSEIAYVLFFAVIFFALVASFALVFALRYIRVRSLTVIMLAALIMGVTAVFVDYGWDYAHFRNVARAALDLRASEDDTRLNQAVEGLVGTGGVVGYLVLAAQSNDLTLIGARVSDPLAPPNALAASTDTPPFGLRIDSPPPPPTTGPANDGIFKYIQFGYMILESALLIGVLIFATRRSAIELIATEHAADDGVVDASEDAEDAEDDEEDEEDGDTDEDTAV